MFFLCFCACFCVKYLRNQAPSCCSCSCQQPRSDPRVQLVLGARNLGERGLLLVRDGILVAPPPSCGSWHRVVTRL
jgi:hypothetical protein